MSDESPPIEREKPIVFYSWQSDLPNSTNRGFIEECLERAIKQLHSEGAVQVIPRLDRDTEDVPGSPEIARTIFRKIDKCSVFVGDLSIINSAQPAESGEKLSRRTPNPNVLIELGYALRKLGWRRIVNVVNTAFGDVSELPFDVKGRRILTYSLRAGEDKASERGALVSKLVRQLARILNMPNVAKPAVEVYFADPDSRQNLGEEIEFLGKTIFDFNFDALPKYNESRGSGISPIQQYLNQEYVNENYYRQLAHFINHARRTKAVSVGITNRMNRLLTGVRFVIDIASMEQVILTEDLPSVPQRKEHAFEFAARQTAELRRRQSGLSIKQRGTSARLEVHFGKIQIGDAAVSPVFRLGTIGLLDLQLNGFVYADQIPPQPCQLVFKGNTGFYSPSTSDLMSELIAWDEKLVITQVSCGLMK